MGDQDKWSLINGCPLNFCHFLAIGPIDLIDNTVKSREKLSDFSSPWALWPKIAKKWRKINEQALIEKGIQGAFQLLHPVYWKSDCMWSMGENLCRCARE